MHRIESLEISGFKSFRNKVKVTFSGGISAVVGPNGCGKSNICDSFLWVMGEQSAKVLRGTRMDDVIFNGTQRYGPVSLADVTLKLKYIPQEGEDDLLPSQEDIEISRRLYRDGNGEYFLNGKRCRLMDIQETFEGTGLGYTSYAIIEQGRIQDVISSKPLEKRALIEEAARIISFKHRKKSALMKLESAEQNLLRIRDLLSEIERNLRSLHSQVQKAKRYRHIRERMRVFLKARFILLRTDLTRSLDDAKHQLAGKERDVETVAKTLQEKGESLNGLKVELFSSEKNLRQAQDELNDTQFEIQRITLSDAHLKARLEEMAQREEAIGRELQEIAERRQNRENRLQEVLQHADSMEKNLEEASGRLKALAESHAEKNRELSELERELESLRRKVFEDAGRLSGLRNNETRFFERECWVEKERVRLDNALSGHQAAAKALEAELARLDGTLEELKNKAEDLEEEKARCQDGITFLRHQKSDLVSRQNEKEKDLASTRLRLKSIDELEARNELFSETVKKFLPRISSHPAFRGAVADHLEAGEGFNTVAEGFLRDDLETLVVDDPDLLRLGAEFIRENKGGAFRFLLDHKQTELPEKPVGVPPAGQGVIGRLLDSIQPDDRGASLLRRVFPDIGRVWLVEDLASAIATTQAFPEAICLSLDGAAVESSGKVTIFSTAAGKGVLGFRKEKKELQQRLLTVERECEQFRRDMEDLDAQLGESEETLSSLDDLLREYKIGAMNCQSEIRRKSEEHRRQANLARTVEAELGAVLADRERLSVELSSVRQEIAALEASSVSLKNEHEQCSLNVQRLRTEAEELGRSLSDVKSEHGAARERLASAASEKRQMKTALEEFDRRERNLLEERAGLVERKSKSRQEQAANATGLEETAARSKRLEEVVRKFSRESDNLRSVLSAAENSMDAIREQLEAHREQKTTHELNQVRIAAELSHLADSVAEEFHLELAHLSAEDDQETAGLDADALLENYQRFRDQAEKMGAVNLAAMEEFEREEERLLFHRSQEADISASIESTRKAIEEIDRRSVKLFRETFDRINRNFQEMFSALFGGGTAEMRLVDEENILESGVDIVASPPGKKLQNILLLSGGEKALTALSLMLALFRYRPSPFCILDEVDAPLDESNIDRFVSLIKEMSTRTQYILITHNKRTMEIADTIFGVTMEEAGVSKVLSVQLKDVENIL